MKDSCEWSVWDIPYSQKQCYCIDVRLLVYSGLYTIVKNMDYLESTIEALVFDVLICWKWLGINQCKASTFTLLIYENSMCIQWFVPGIMQHLRPISGQKIWALKQNDRKVWIKVQYIFHLVSYRKSVTFLWIMFTEIRRTMVQNCN